MKWPAGPYTVAPGVLSIPLPAGANQSLLSGVVIENNSQYLLSVGPYGEWLQPFSPGWFGQDTLNAAQLQVKAQSVGQASASDGQLLTAMFYGNDEPQPTLAPFAADPITVAQSLAATGTPNVLLTAKLYSSNSANPLLAQQVAGIGSVGSYASLTITTQDVNIGPAGPTSLKLEWFMATDANGNPLGQPAVTEYLTSAVGTAPNGAWTLPVPAPYLQITNARPAGGRALGVNVYGSNRAVPRAAQLGNSNTIRQFKTAGAVVTAGPVVALTNGDGGPDASSLSGQCYVRASCSGASGFFAGFQWLQPGSNALSQTYFSSKIAAGGEWEGLIAHPLAVVQPVMLPVAPFGATNYLLEITQA